MAEQVFLSVDLGASGGRVLAGLLDGGRLRLEELHRFDNAGVAVGESLHWDVLRLWSEVQAGLRAAASRFGDNIVSVGVDTWGVDFALLGRDDVLLGNPYTYRDRRTQGMLAQVLQQVSREEIFAHTGLQFMEINTLFQLFAMRQSNSPLLDMTERLLLIPDLFHWLLTGERTNETTNASTTQFFNPVRRTWATELLDKLDLPTHMLGELIEPGTTIGPLQRSVLAETGLASSVRVIAPGTHDTASAVLAVPAATAAEQRPDWCYVSSGTWALMGVETPEPVMSPKCLQLTFTNEGGVGRTNRLLKNITGLWLVQECRREWARGGREYSWGELTSLAERAPPLAALVDPDHPTLQAPDDMPAAIRALCQQTGQSVPESEGALVRCAVESIAMKCRYVLSALEELVGGRLETIHIVGGGTQNALLCQATANACARPVVAGPVEATAIGNCTMQAIAAGSLGSIAEARHLVRQSFPVQTYEPRDTPQWEAAYERFNAMLL